ncbi:hypothetical protein GCM10020001_106960 [Nonomuraea salmonea]
MNTDTTAARPLYRARPFDERRVDHPPPGHRLMAGPEERPSLIERPARDEHADVVIVGAGPTGLMLAAELRLAGVRPLVLERRPRSRDVPKAGGLGGQILHLLHFRGLLERFQAACTGPMPAPRFPFGGVHLDFTGVQDPPMHALPLPQQVLERLLAERAEELGVAVRRGHEVSALTQDEARRGPRCSDLTAPTG